MTKYKILFALCFVVLLIGIGSSSLGTYKQNECVNIVTVLNASNVNISVLTNPTPNSQIVIQNVQMTSLGNSFNYTFCNTTKIGDYTYGYCDDKGNCYSNDFMITPSGNNAVSSGESIVYLVSVITMALMTLLFYMMSTHFADKKGEGNEVVKGKAGLRFGFLGLSLVISLVTVLYSYISLTQMLAGFSNILSSYSYFQYIILIVFFIIFIFVLISLTIQAMEALKIKRGLKDED